MIVDQRYVDYINSLEKELPPYLEELEQYALQTEVPIIRKEMQSFLKTLLKMNKPKQILEVGTAIGFSALLMKEFMPADGQITTIEKYEKRIPVARANFEAHGDGRITLLEGDAMEILAGLTGSYDMIFMDAAKDSISILCRMCSGFWHRAVYYCLIMCCRMGISSSPAMR